MPAYNRFIQPNDYYHYTYPVISSLCPAKVFFPIMVLIPLFVSFYYYFLHRDKVETVEAILAFSLGISLTEFITDLLKNTVGRPRPNFLTKCFPSGYYPSDLVCTEGGSYNINGRKSFPSGHASCKLT